MFKHDFKIDSGDSRFVQVGLEEREIIFRKSQRKIFQLLIDSKYLDVLPRIDKNTGEYMKEGYTYGKRGGEAKRYAIPLRFWGTSPKYKIIDDNCPVIERVVTNLKRKKAKIVKAIEEQALKDMQEALKTVKFSIAKVTDAILSEGNCDMQMLNTHRICGLNLLDYVHYLNDLTDCHAYHDYFGERFQHYKLNSPKAVRKCSLYFQGFEQEKVVELDIANSQPFFLCCLTPEVVKCILPEFDSKELTDIIVKMRRSESFRRFRNSCVNGTLKKDFSTIFGDKFSESKIKDIIFLVMYCDYEKKNLKYSKQIDAFKQIYPEVYEALAAIKKLDWEHLKKKCSEASRRKGSYTNASMLIQRLESRIMLKYVVPVINRDKAIDNMTFFTIHDSVVCLDRDKERIMQLIKNVFKNLGLDEPTINEKDD